jgi:F0F1-type ATP synthase membrane subunit b/b'
MLDINFTTVIWQIINFLALAAALYFLLFKAVMRVVEKRTEEKNRLINELKEKNIEVDRMRAELEEQLAQADEMVNEIVENAEKQIQKNHDRMLERARQETEVILGEAYSEAQAIQQQSMEAFYERVLDTIIDIGGKVIGKAAPTELNEIFVREINDTLWDLGRGNIRQVQTLRDSLGDRKPTVYVNTAHELTPEQQRQLVRTFSALANRNVTVEIEIDPSLVMGTRIRIGDMIVENSVAARLNDLRDEVREHLSEWMPNE